MAQHTGIDKRLMFYWETPGAVGLQAAQGVPEWLEGNLDNWRALNPGYQVDIVDGETISEMLAEFDPELQALFEQLAIPSARSDVARLIWIYRYGGMYIDSATGCKKAVGALFEEASKHDFLLAAHPEHLEAPSVFTHPLRTGAFLGKKDCQVLKVVLHQITRNLHDVLLWQKSGRKYTYNVSEIMGPRFLARWLREQPCEAAQNPPEPHCRECAKMTDNLVKYKTAIMDMEDYLAWHQHSSYRIHQDGRFKDCHWSVLQNHIPLFNLNRG